MKCQPGYITPTAGMSKICCKFMDDFEKELGIKIQHAHYDYLIGSVVGEEYSDPRWAKKRVDGFYVDTNGTKIIVEFMGDYFHGHPRYWKNDEDALNCYHSTYKSTFERTKLHLQKLRALDYKVMYVWESDYKTKPAISTIASICFIFEDERLNTTKNKHYIWKLIGHVIDTEPYRQCQHEVGSRPRGRSAPVLH